MRISALDPAGVSEQDRQDWHRLNLAARRVDHPDDPAPVYAHSARRLVPPPAGDRRCWFARGGDGDLLGGALLTRDGHENGHLVNVNVRVHPHSRRRRVGRALFEAAAGSVDGPGVTTLFGFAPGTGPGAEFAVAMGMRRGMEGFRTVPANRSPWTSPPFPNYLTFDVDPETFARILARIRAMGVPYGSDPAEPDNGRVDHPLWARGMYFADTTGNLYELTSPA